MTSQSSGGSGSGLPGVTGDGMTPGGEIIAGALTAGDPHAASVPSQHVLNGWTTFNDSPGNHVDGDNVLAVVQAQPLAGDSTSAGVSVYRGSTLNGHDFSAPLVSIADVTAASQPAFKVFKGGATQLQVDGDGVRIHGKFKTGAAVAHTAAVLSGQCVPIYDESGTLLGYVPLYN